MYSWIKPLLFAQDAERVHDFVMRGMTALAQQHWALKQLESYCGVQGLETSCMGLSFPNPIGLAAGLDKNALALPAWAALGFGFIEIGSVTAKGQPGNDKPRLFRLPSDEALINRMGFNNHGSKVVAARLELWQHTHGAPRIPLGINLGKSKVTPLEDAPKDYIESLTKLWEYGDYFVINVSSPNTPGLRQLQDRGPLEELLRTVKDFAKARPVQKPIALKIAPDLTWEQIDEILELTEAHGIDALIATNTTIARDGLKTPINEAGGLSGQPLKARALEVLKYIAPKTRTPIISVGGIQTPRDVAERLEHGAKLVQLYTGFIYEGPMLPRTLARGLLELRR
jgi:dihydroorotate dehydrogenase